MDEVLRSGGSSAACFLNTASKKMEDMFDPTPAMQSLQQQIDKMLKEFAETKDLEKRVQLSQVIKNLSDSVGVYLSFAAGMAASFDEADFGEEYGDEFEDD